MRRSKRLSREMKTFFKKTTNRVLRRETKHAINQISKHDGDPDNISLTPSYRMHTIWKYY